MTARVRSFIAAVCLALLALASFAEGAADETVLVSRQSSADGGAGGDGNSEELSISGDGRLVAFESDADNLSDVDDDGANGTDVFVRDVEAGVTTLVSRQNGAEGAGGDGNSEQPAISSDGRVVAFQSMADNLSEADNGVVDVFVRNLQANNTILVSRQSAADGGAAGDGDSDHPSISPDGRLVAFGSEANNLSSADSDGVGDVFVRDLQTNSTVLLSRQSGAEGAGGNGSSGEPSISADGRLVAFSSNADNLSSADDNEETNIFVRDLQTNQTILVSQKDGAGGDDDSFAPSISADGRFVGFHSRSDNLSSEDDNSVMNVFVRDLQSNQTILVSRQAGAGGAAADDGSFGASLSADGSLVAFESNADNLSAEDTDGGVTDIFVRDMQSNSLTFLSRQSGAAGAGGDKDSFTPGISVDGRFVAFWSFADNLSSEDSDGIYDVFRRELPPQAPTAGPAPAPPPAPEPSAAKCAAKRATMVGDSGRDVIRGTGRRDVIAAGGGNDTVKGLGGNDLVCGGAGKDTLLGGGGKDDLRGEGGADTLKGGKGADSLSGGNGGDTLRGEAGKDKLRGGRGGDHERQ